MTEEEKRIYQEFEDRFKEAVSKDKRIQNLAEKLADGTATYRDAWEYANKVGHVGSRTLIDQADQLIADDIDGYEAIMDALYDCYDQSATYAAAVQTLENKKAGIGIKGTQADFDRSRASGIAHLGANAEDVDSAVRVLGTPVEHFTENVVGDTIKANEEFQYRSGLSPKIKRTSSGKCCKWCDEVAGIYDYPAPDEVYRRHRNCNCLVEYYPGNGLKQNVHTKKWANEELKKENAAYAVRPPSYIDLVRRMEEGTSKENNQGIIAQKILNGEYSLRQRHQKYLQHIQGTKQYENATRSRGREQSYLTVSEEVAQELIYRFAGKGELRRINGVLSTDKEYVSVDRITGKYFERGAWHETDRIMILYSKKGSHIVPVKRK